MSDDSADAPADAPAGPAPAPRDAPAPDAAPAPEGPPAAISPPDRRAWHRQTLLAGLLVVALVGAWLVVRGHGAGPARGSAPLAGDGRPALSAPVGPGIPVEAGGPQLTGFVVDGAGAPVVGAEIAAELEEPAPVRVPDAGVPVVPSPLAAGDAGPGVHVGAATGADGRFVIAGLTPGRYRLRVTGPGLLPSEVRFVPVPSDATRIVVARQVAIEGTVSDQGRPVAGVTVGLRGDAIGGAIEIRTDARGAFAFAELPEGRFQLFAWQGALAARAVRVGRLGVGPFAPVELRLEAAAIVVGRVIDREEGTGVPAAVELRPVGDDQAPRHVRTSDDGAFRIEGVPDGAWIVDAFAPGYLSLGGVEIEAGRGVPELALARGATLEGRVLDGGGRPIAGASVRALVGGASPLVGGASPLEWSAVIDQERLRRFSGRMAAPAQGPAQGRASAAADPLLIPRGELGVLSGPIPPIPPPGAQVARPAQLDPGASPVMAALVGEPAPLAVDPDRASVWVTGPDGRYRIRGLPRGKVTALAIAPGFAEGRAHEQALEPGQLVPDVDIALGAGTMIVGTITDQHGVPVIGALVSVRPTVGASLDAFTDDRGAYRVGPVTGALALVASAYGHGEVRRTLDLAAAAAPATGPAEHTEDLVLVVADATLAGTLDDVNGTPVAGAQLEIVGSGADGRQAVVAADGTFRFAQLPAGTLRVRIRHPDYPPHEVDAVATSGLAPSVRLRLPLGGAVEGVVLDATTGAPLTSILLTGAGPAGATADASTDKLGRWRLGPLAPGAWRLAIKLPGYRPLSTDVDVRVARIPGGTSVRDVRLELARGALVGGTVRDARGNRVVGAIVTIMPIRAGEGGLEVEGVTDSVGEFRIRDVPGGELSVTVRKGDALGTARVTVRPGTEVLGLSLDIR